MSEEEIWKVIPGYSRYEASNLGRIRRLSDGFVIKPLLTGIPEYYHVNATPDGGTNNVRRLHRLVAKAFIENPDNLPVVDHINRNPLDNRAENLRWVTRSGNGRNQHNNFYVEYQGENKLLLEVVEELFGEQDDSLIYQFLYGRIKTKGETLHQALEEYQRYTDVGMKLKKVEYKGEMIFLKTLCDEKGYDYRQCSSRLNQGWSEWNVVYNINPHTKGQQLRFGDAMLWFRDEISAQELFSIGPSTLERLHEIDYDFANIESYDRFESSRDSFRQDVLGVRGTIPELADHFGKTLSCVQSRLKKGMSLQDALTIPVERLKYVTIDGQRRTLKAWYSHFDLPDSKVRSWRDRNKGVSFSKTLENFGVDISSLKILEG